MYRNKERRLLKKTFHYNIDSQTLANIYAAAKVVFSPHLSMAEVSKTCLSGRPDRHPGGLPGTSRAFELWRDDPRHLTAFHLADEYKKGTANSWQDRRSYDIKHHSMDVTVTGTRLTIKARSLLRCEANVRFLPFDLYSTLTSRGDGWKTAALLFLSRRKRTRTPILA